MGTVEYRGERESSSQERCKTLLSFLFTSRLLSLCSGRRVITLCLSSTVFSLAEDIPPNMTLNACFLWPFWSTVHKCNPRIIKTLCFSTEAGRIRLYTRPGCSQVRCCPMAWSFGWNPRPAPGTCTLREERQELQKKNPNLTPTEQGQNDREKWRTGLDLNTSHLWREGVWKKGLERIRTVTWVCILNGQVYSPLMGQG